MSSASLACQVLRCNIFIYLGVNGFLKGDYIAFSCVLSVLFIQILAFIYKSNCIDGLCGLAPKWVGVLHAILVCSICFCITWLLFVGMRNSDFEFIGFGLILCALLGYTVYSRENYRHWLAVGSGFLMLL